MQEVCKIVKFHQKLDRNNKIYIVRPLREMGLEGTIEIMPNSRAAVIYRSGTDVEDVLESIQIIAKDLEHQTKRKS